MKRLTAAILAFLLLPGVALAAPARPAKAPAVRATDWQKVIVATPEGGFRIGNPDARVKLIEYGSLTCPHCAHFHAEAMTAIKRDYVATGKVSFEFRNFVLNGPDYAASLLARCQGAKGFFPLAAAFYTDQKKWMEPLANLDDEAAKRIQAAPADKQIGLMAVAGKLDGFVAPLGIDRARFDACIADKAAVDKLLAMRKDAVNTWKLTGTPGFIINGEAQAGVYDWPTLEPLLKAAVG